MPKQRGPNLRGCVTQRLEEIERELRRMPSRMADDTGRVTAHDDLVHNDDAITLARINRLTEERHSLRLVLERLERGVPITCIEENCGQPIPLQRLKACPSARRCFRCQTQVERTTLSFRLRTGGVRIHAMA